MPPVIAFVVLYAAQIAAAITIASAIYAAAQAKKQAKQMEEDFRRSQEAAEALAKQQSAFDGAGGGGGGAGREDSKLMLKTSKAPRNVVFGEDRVSGPIACFFSFEFGEDLFHRFAVVLAGHECDSIQTIYFNEDPVQLDAAGWVVTPKYCDNGRRLFYIEKHLGGPAQTASALLIEGATLAGSPSSWDATRRGVGVCYVAVLMEAHFDTLKQIGLPNISAVVRGVKCLDTRTNVTAWTQNPALLARWWLVDSIYSPLTESTEIDVTELNASANVCDEVILFDAGVGGIRYECGGSLTTSANPLDNLEKIIQSMDGDAVWISGKWHITAGYYKTPGLNIDESSLGAGAITISPYTPTAQLINAISGQFKGPSTLYQPAGYAIISPPTYITEDGGQLYEKKSDFALVNNPLRCQMIAWQQLSRARQQLAINIDCNLKAYDTAPLKNVTLSMAEFGYSNKVFEVRRRSFIGTHIEYSLQETGPEVWAWDYTKAQQAVEIPNVNIQADFSVPALTDVYITSGTESLQLNKDGTITSRMLIEWRQVPRYFVIHGGHIEWQYRKQGATNWLSSTTLDGDATRTYISPVVDGETYEVIGRAISQIGNAGPTFATPILHTVIGKTEPPSDVTGFSIDGDVVSWTPVTDLDLAGYELRFHYGNNGDWGTATPLSTGLITESPFALVTRPAGVVSLMMKAIDTTGNYSLLPARIVTDLGDPFLANVIQTIDFHPTFAGGVTGGSLVGIELLASALDSFYGPDNASFYDESALPFYETGAYGSMVYTSGDVVIVGALRGSLATLLLDYAGDGLTIEYRSAGPDPFYDLDGDSFYGPDLEPFYGGAGPWQAWGGQVALIDSAYNFRVSIANGVTRGRITTMQLIVDAPDMLETVNDLTVSALGTVVTFSNPFTAIKNIQATLQANGSGAETVEIDKTNPVAPKVRCFNSSHVAVSGATVDLFLKGY